MKLKIFLTLCICLSMLLLGANVLIAAQEGSVLSIENQIKALQEKIRYLQKLIANMTLEKEILADSYLVVDLSGNEVILSKNIHEPYTIASITKLMNAVVAQENLTNDQSIVLTSNMLKPYGYSPSLFLGLDVSVKNLLKASLIQSTNDAAESLSYFIGNEAFIELMNKKARDLGMENTYYYDAHGMDARNHSTAQDLLKLVSYISEHHPDVWSITKDNNFWLPDPTGKMLHFKNLNVFYDDPNFIGGKTGYLTEAKESFASVFELSGKKFAVIVLKSPDRKADVVKIITWLKTNSIQ